MSNTKVTSYLSAQKKKVNTYEAQFNKAVASITTMLDALTESSRNIDQEIAEIEQYRTELSTTVSELMSTKDKNDNVVKNFRALLGKSE